MPYEIVRSLSLSEKAVITHHTVTVVTITNSQIRQPLYISVYSWLLPENSINQTWNIRTTIQKFSKWIPLIYLFSVYPLLPPPQRKRIARANGREGVERRGNKITKTTLRYFEMHGYRNDDACKLSINNFSLIRGVSSNTSNDALCIQQN